MSSKPYKDLSDWSGLRDWLQARSYAVLCGAGISKRAGLPIGQNFISSFLDKLILDNYRGIVESHLADDKATQPPILLRFEGILEIWKRVCDPQLEILNVFATGVPTSEHYALARIAHSHHVVTVNFDDLIERAADNPSRLKIGLEDPDFTSTARAGLYKLHGSIAPKPSHSPLRSATSSIANPVVTLGAISTCMESVARREYIYELRRTRPMVVIGYSGMDDFDVCRWLFDATDQMEVVWITYSPKDTPLRILSAEEAFLEDLAPRPFKKAQKHSDINKWKVIVSHQPAQLLADLSGELFKDESYPTTEIDWVVPSSWEKVAITALTLIQLSRFADAAILLQRALDTNSLTKEQDALTKLFAVEALIPIGKKAKRITAFRYATEVAASDSVAIADRQRALFLKLQSGVLAGQLAGNDIAPLLEEIGLDAAARNDFELAADVDVFGAQRARSHGGFKDGVQNAIREGSLLAKAIRLHETVRNAWLGVESPASLKSLIQEMRKVVAFRFDVGQLDGAVASMTVCGTMLQRYSEWLSERPLQYTESIEMLEEALMRTNEAGLVWHHAQALINLAYISAKSENIAQLEERIIALDKMREDLDNADLCHIQFLKIYPKVIAGDFLGAADDFRALTQYDAAKHNQRFTLAAAFNANVCRAWGVISEELPCTLPSSHSGIPFWNQRFLRLNRQANASSLLDLLPPSVSKA